MVKRLLIMQVNFIWIISVLLGCGGEKTSPAQDSSGLGTKIRLPDTLSDLALIADKQGFFAEQHIEIEWTGVQAHGPANIVSIIAGHNDAAFSISTAMIDAINNGAKIKIVCAGSPTEKTEANQIWLTLEQSGINGPEDFIGKKITGSSGTITWYPVVEYFRKHNLDIDKVEFVTLPTAQQEQALRQGEVAAIGLSNTYANRILANGGVKLLFTDYDVLGIEHVGGYAFTVDFIEKHPDAVRGFVIALSNTVKWIRAREDNYKEAASYLFDRIGNYLRNTWKDEDEKLLLNDNDIQTWLDILAIYGNIKPGQYRPADIYTNEFNPYFEP